MKALRFLALGVALAFASAAAHSATPDIYPAPSQAHADLAAALRTAAASHKRVLAMFSDPYCPACRQFERSLAQIDNVTIYVFMYPVIRPENIDSSSFAPSSATSSAGSTP